MPRLCKALRPKKGTEVLDRSQHSQDPAVFAMQMASRIQTNVDPTFLEKLDIETVRRYFFINHSWRLTNSGFAMVSMYHAHYTSNNPKNGIITGKMLLNMDHIIGGPWFMRGSQIIVFDQMANFELEMVDGDINAYIDFKRPKVL